MLATLLTALYFFACGVLAHLVLCWVVSSGRFMRDGLLIGFATILFAMVWQFQSGNTDLVALFLLLTAWLAYLMFFINLLNSVTLKMLECLAGAPGSVMKETDFTSIFNEESGLKARLADMEANAFVKTKEGRLFLTVKASRFLAIISLLKKILSTHA